MRLEIVLEQEEDGTYSVHCPALKGCHSQGTTREEALKNIREAIQLYLEVAPNHATVAKGTERGLIKDAGLTVEEFNKLLKKQNSNR